MPKAILLLTVFWLSIPESYSQNADEVKRLQKRLEECEAQVNQARKEAAVYRLAAEKAEKEFQRQRYLAIASALASKSLEINDKELAALLAVQAYNFNSSYNGYDYNSSVYEGLVTALRRYDSLAVKLNNPSQSSSALLVKAKTDTARMGRNLVVADDKGGIMIVTNGIVRMRLSGHQARVEHIVISPSRKFMVTVSKDMTLCIWNLSNLTSHPLVIKENTSIEGVAFSSDEKQILVSVKKQEPIHVWPLTMETMAKTLCSCVQRNMSLEEWEQYVGSDGNDNGRGVPYGATCKK